MGEHNPKVGVVLEQSLGHVSHGRNLRKSLAESQTAQVLFRDVPYEPNGLLDRVPPRSNWTIRSGLRARRAVRELQREHPLDALFVHTQVPATLLGPVMKRIPTVISLDATPVQIDELGTSYGHRVFPAALERLKSFVQGTVFRRAQGLICWSQWAADSLVDDYGVDPDRIDVIPPGVIIKQWSHPTPRIPDPTTVRILFVGGDFERKGGGILIQAVERLRSDVEVARAGIGIRLHLVTTDPDVEAGPGIHVHRHLTPNCPELVDLYHRCDLFALPTSGDCSPLALAEASAAGLASVTTDIGAIRETVIDGVTGHLVEPTVESVAAALRKLVLDPEYRHRLGVNAAEHAARTMDAEANAQRILSRLVDIATPAKHRGRTLLTVSGEVAADIRQEIAAGTRPVADYIAIADAADAEIIDRSTVSRNGSTVARVLGRIAGPNVAMAWHLYRQRDEVDVVVTDGEQVGLALAMLLRLGGRRGLRHVMIGHRLSPAKKSLLIRSLGLARGVDEVLVYATHQLHVAQDLFNHPGHRVRLIDFMVDTSFFRPSGSTISRPNERPLLCSAGLEFRDYPTLINAVGRLDVDLVIASASQWSRRAEITHDIDLPPNVTIGAFSHCELRDLFARADIAVVPLQPADFQAGITTILEAMATELPVVCTDTVGQIDVVVEGVNGRYVPPGDVGIMRRVIQEMIDDPVASREMGLNGRRLVSERADVRDYANLFADIVRWHLATADHWRALDAAT